MGKPGRLPRRPYAFAILASAALVGVAWAGRNGRRVPGPGVRAPAFEVMTLTGERARLADYAGRVILLNIWATWCPPCREEMPSMQRLYERFQKVGADFTIMAVSIDAPLGKADANGKVGGDLRAFAEEYGLTFPILHDPSGDIQRIYYTTGVPESFLIGRDGIIYRRLAGATNWDSEEHQAAVRRLLDGAPPTTEPSE